MKRVFCAGGLIFFKAKLLVLKRFNGVWLFPKGHIDPGESSLETAIREIKEECGLNVLTLTELGETNYSITEKGEEQLKNVQWFLVEAVEDDDNVIKLEKEFFIDYKLLSEQEINLLTFVHDREMAKLAFQLYKQYVEDKEK